MNQAGTAPSFEALRDTIGNAVPAGAPGVREAVALEPTGSLAAARDPDGRLELFLLGPELQPRLATVRERLVYDTWAGANALRFTANRILLPAGHHIDAVAALICTELLSHGYPQGPLDAFVKAEPVIDLVLTPATQAGHILTGLAGELTFLAALVGAERSAAAEHVVAAWHGWRPSSRDFQLGPVGVEVKTSTTGASTHRIQGWYQVEPGAAVDGTQETSLYLLSLGIRWLRHGAPGESIEGLLEQICRRLDSQGADELRDRVTRYGGLTLELDTEGGAAQKALQRPFTVEFERLFDMSDPLIKVPRSADFAEFSHLLPDSVQFTVSLPAKVRGDRNPITSLRSITTKVLGLARA